MESFRRWSIKTKSVSLLAGYAIFLLGVYGGFTTFLLGRETAAAHDRLQQTARLVATEIDAHLEAGKQRLAMVAALPGLVYGLHRLEESGDGGHIPPWTTLHYLFYNSPAFTGGVFLLDRTGKVLWTEPPGLPWVGSTLADDAHVMALYGTSGTPVSPGVERDALLPAPHVVIGYPIVGPDGGVVGLLGGVIDLTAAGFSGIFRALSTTEGRYLSVVDQDGRVISSTDAAQLLAAAPVAPLGDETGPLATAALGQAPWRVVAGEPRETALAPVRQLQRMLLGIGAGMLLLAVAVGSRFVGGFVGAIQRLTHSAEIMASGDLSQPVTREDRHGELATLGSTFERMRTELRDSHAALTQRLAEREELMRLKEEFLANISHELRTPLNVIFGYTDMLSSDEDDPERRDALGRIRAQSEQLLQLVRDLMTLSGLNAGKIAVELCPVNVDELIGRIRALAEQLARGRSIAAVFEVPASVPALHTDPLRLEQILSNLVTNAFKFTTEGRVTVRVRYPARDDRVLFEVADTGIGIAERELAHIFDEFRQVDGSMSRAHGGMGLGLALVRRLVGLLGGEVSVVSRLGEGSTFTVALPVHHPGSDTLSPGQAA